MMTLIVIMLEIIGVLIMLMVTEIMRGISQVVVVKEKMLEMVREEEFVEVVIHAHFSFKAINGE